MSNNFHIFGLPLDLWLKMGLLWLHWQICTWHLIYPCYAREPTRCMSSVYVHKGALRMFKVGIGACALSCCVMCSFFRDSSVFLFARNPGQRSGVLDSSVFTVSFLPP